ncbi:VOC family protein [Devosia sp.]|uniref:VOC family protein n=1 Tax=Devosia sp. TaxID=1871048 RepID=UPI003A91C8BA
MAVFTIDYFELQSTDLSASKGFFGDAFGFGHTDYGPGYSEITEAGILGGLNAEPEEGVATSVIGIRTDDIAAGEAAITAAGGTIVIPTYDYPGGQRLFFREPGGAVLMLYCPSA